jgi:hypothetical protein
LGPFSLVLVGVLAWLICGLLLEGLNRGLRVFFVRYHRFFIINPLNSISSTTNYSSTNVPQFSSFIHQPPYSLLKRPVVFLPVDHLPNLPRHPLRLFGSFLDLQSIFAFLTF